MKRLRFAMLLLATQLSYVYGQVNYNDVAVIINDNSQFSIDIGNYFQQARNIPAQNMIHISCSVNEEVDTLEFASIRQQIESYLTTNNISDSINYLVTTKGVPLKLFRPYTGSFPDHPYLNSTAIDSELALILSGSSGEIAQNGVVNNGYYLSDSLFDRSVYDMYLVTRLTGYTVNDVYNLIDRSGPQVITDKNYVKFIFDISNLNNQFAQAEFNNSSIYAIDSLMLESWQTILDSSGNYLLNQSLVLGYSGLFGSITNFNPGHGWTEGALVNMTGEFPLNTFTPNTANSTALLADLIEEGACGGMGSVYYTYISTIGTSRDLFNYYTDFAKGYNLAESCYANIITLSTWYAVVGDPKTSLKLGSLASIDELDLEELVIYPNPVNNGYLYFSTDKIDEVEIYALNGKQIVKHSKLEGNYINVSELTNGIYLIKISSNGLTQQKKFVKM